MTTIEPAQFIRSQNYGVLSTHSVTERGYPFGSITAYIVTKEGDLAIFISDLAEHTRNIKVNPKVSITIFSIENSNDPSASTRITCLATAKLVEEQTQLRKDYLKHFPDTATTLELAGFNFYRLKITKIRLVAGFGQISWLEPASLLF